MKNAHLCHRLARKTPRGAISRKRSFPSGSQPLNGGSRRGGGRLHSFRSHRWIAITCAPMADSVLASAAQWEVQAVIQQFPYRCADRATELEWPVSELKWSPIQWADNLVTHIYCKETQISSTVITSGWSCHHRWTEPHIFSAELAHGCTWHTNTTSAAVSFPPLLKAWEFGDNFSQISQKFHLTKHTVA